MVKITDEASVKAWLKDKPHAVQVTFAARCALRAVPGIGLGDDANLGAIALPVLRAVLTSGVAGTCPTPDVKAQIRDAAATAAADSAYALSPAASAASAASVDSAFSAAADSAAGSAVAVAFTDSPALPADLAASAASAAFSAAFSAASDDATWLVGGPPEALFSQPLWPADTMPEGLRDALDKLTTFWAKAPETWGFWRDWYQGMLTRQPMDWKLQERIALIPDEEWEKGAKNIAEIVERYRKEATEKPPDREVVRQQIDRLIERADATEITASGLADLIDEVIHEFMHEAGLNCLPAEFEPLERIPPILRRIAKSVRSTDADKGTKALEDEIVQLHARIAELESALHTVRAKTLTGTFSKAFWEQAGKSLGDWKMWGALIGGGYVILGDAALSARISGMASTLGDLFPKSGQPALPETAPFQPGTRV